MKTKVESYAAKCGAHISPDSRKSSTQTVLFLGNGRCYHTMDWFRSAQRLYPNRPPVLVTDLIEGESFEKLIRPTDLVERLFILDGILSRKQCRTGDIWRNIIKLLVLPLQVWRLREVAGRYKNPILHAHSTYYIAMARASGFSYVGTPQGSEVLVRPHRSWIYRAFAWYALKGAARITVDSTAMRHDIAELFGLDATIVQNGIDIDAMRELEAPSGIRDKVVSVRGVAPNYQIDLILDERNRTLPDLQIHFCYPFSDEEYRAAIADRLISKDVDLGRLARRDLYRLLQSAMLVISIPLSDSSPRSVYEAILCGCVVATTDGMWIEQLPSCMRARIVLVNPYSDGWLRDAFEIAQERVAQPYVPSVEALQMFDQKQSMRKLFEDVFPSMFRV